MNIHTSLLKTMWLPRLIPNVYVRSACYMKSRPMKQTASVTDTKSFSGYEALHRVCSECMWSRPHICSNITRHVVHYHSIRGPREVQSHYFLTTSLNWDFFKCTIGPLYPVGKNQRHTLKRRSGRADGCDGRFGYKTKHLLLPVSNHKLSKTQTIVLSLHWMIHRRFNT